LYNLVRLIPIASRVRKDVIHDVVMFTEIHHHI
jgi:hypothetical protein